MKKFIAAAVMAVALVGGTAGAASAALAPVAPKVSTTSSCYELPIGFLVDGKFVWNPAYLACLKK